MQSEQLQATDLRGKVAIVTGASSGIGEAIAEELVQRGARVALFARRENRLRELAQRLAGRGSDEPLIVPGDVSKPEDVQNLVNQTVQRWGKLDIVIANAGFGYRSSIVDGDPQRWKDLLDTNVYGLLLTLKYGVEQLLKHGSGHVVVTSSIAGRSVTAGGAVYSGSKFAVTAIAEALRHLLAAICQSSAYQLSARFDGEWKEAYTRYFARKFVRMLDAEELHDAIALATDRPGSFAAEFCGNVDSDGLTF